MKGRTAILAAAVGAICALAAVSGEVFQVDKTVPFPKTGLGALNFKAGPITFEEIVIRNMPDEEDLAEAKKDPDDSCHPKLQVGLSNSGSVKMKVHLIVKLEDGQGNIYMSCDREDTVDPGATNDHTNLCLVSSMKTLDFPKVTRVRIIASVSPD